MTHKFSMYTKSAQMNLPKKLMSEQFMKSNPAKLARDLTALPATADFYLHLLGWRVLISNPVHK